MARKQEYLMDAALHIRKVGMIWGCGLKRQGWNS
jgi:hypothetical protein